MQVFYTVLCAKEYYYVFKNYFTNKQYSRVKKLGDKLAEIDPLID